MEDFVRDQIGSTFHLGWVLFRRRFLLASRAVHVRNSSPTIFFFLLDQSGRTNVASGNGGWATVGVPRIVAIAVLNGFGMHAFDDLPVVRFGVDERDKGLLTPQYSFALAQNFRPERDYQANIRAIREPFRVLAGQKDEVSYADKFAAFSRQR